MKGDEDLKDSKEVAAMTGETATEAIRKALEERRDRLQFQVVRTDRKAEMFRYLTENVWPRVATEVLGKGISQAEQDELLGYGEGARAGTRLRPTSATA